jgi:hypothetical protein
MDEVEWSGVKQSTQARRPFLYPREVARRRGDWKLACGRVAFDGTGRVEPFAYLLVVSGLIRTPSLRFAGFSAFLALIKCLFLFHSFLDALLNGCQQ